MCLRVYANGGKRGAGILMCLMRGEHDDKLTWPFHRDITIQLVNQNKEQDHVEYTAAFDNRAAAIYRKHDRQSYCSEGERSKSGLGTA